MTRRGMVDAQPYNEPHETQRTGKGEGPSPADPRSDLGNQENGKRAAHARSAVEDGDGDAAFFSGKPFGHRFAGTGPVESFADAEQGSGTGSESEHRIRQAGAGVDDGPEDHSDRQSDTGPHHVDKYAAQKPGHGVGDLESAEDAAQFSVGEMKLGRDYR